MKTNLFLFTFTIITLNAVAQSNNGNGGPAKTTYCETYNLGMDSVYLSSDEMPIFTGDNSVSDLKKWICANAVYPEKALSGDIQGKVYVSFIILPDGTVDDVKITRSSDQVFDEETLKLFSRMPKWIPGKCKGTAVPVKISDLLISYALN